MPKRKSDFDLPKYDDLFTTQEERDEAKLDKIRDIPLELIQDIFNLCFRAGFVIDGFYEECFKTNKEIPMVMIVRLKKVKRDTLQ